MRSHHAAGLALLVLSSCVLQGFSLPQNRWILPQLTFLVLTRQWMQVFSRGVRKEVWFSPGGGEPDKWHWRRKAFGQGGGKPAQHRRRNRHEVRPPHHWHPCRLHWAQPDWQVGWLSETLHNHCSYTTITHRIEGIDLNGEDPFSLRNIAYLGLKLFLAVAGGTSSGIDKSDTVSVLSLPSSIDIWRLGIWCRGGGGSLGDVFICLHPGRPVAASYGSSDRSVDREWRPERGGCDGEAGERGRDIGLVTPWHPPTPTVHNTQIQIQIHELMNHWHRHHLMMCLGDQLGRHSGRGPDHLHEPEVVPRLRLLRGRIGGAARFQEFQNQHILPELFLLWFKVYRPVATGAKNRVLIISEFQAIQSFQTSSNLSLFTFCSNIFSTQKFHKKDLEL